VLSLLTSACILVGSPERGVARHDAPQWGRSAQLNSVLLVREGICVCGRNQRDAICCVVDNLVVESNRPIAVAGEGTVGRDAVTMPRSR